MRAKYVTYSEGLAAEVAELLAQGKSLAAIGRMEGMPSFTSLIRWRHEYPEFQEAYLEALSRRPPGRGPRGPYGTKAQIAARRAAQPAPKRAGRPYRYSARWAEVVCARIAAGASMLELMQDRSLPCGQSLYNWLEDELDFRRRYEAACEIRGEVLAEEMLMIADDASGDYMPGKDGLEANLQAIRRARMMMEARMWQAARLNPRRYVLRKGLGAPDVWAGSRDAPKSWEEMLLELE